MIESRHWLAAGIALPLMAACGGSGDPEVPAPTPKLVASNPEQACQKLASSFQLQGTTVDAATYVAAGFVPPGSATPVAQPFCRVQLTSRPSADSDIKSEIWMPALSAWNGRFLAVGGGGNSGAIQYSAMSNGLSSGYATLSTDNGHQGNDQIFAVGHPEKVIDFGHRAQAVTAVGGKALTQAFYEEAPRKSYWLGCSQGGGKGMMQSQRYPENFDGIVAGSPVFDWVGSQFAPAWVAVKGMRDPSLLVPRAKLPAIHSAVLAACDAKDGLTDGLIQQPERCNFDPATMACPAGTDSASCLTPGQVASMQRYYAPVTRPDGRPIYAAYPPGSEGNSAWLGATAPNGNWGGFWPNVVYENPAYSIVASLNVDTDADYNFAKAKLSAHYDAVSTDLSSYRARGGKLLIWHGYNDAAVSAYHTRDYVDAVTARFGTSQTSEFLRTYFAPGVNHCGGGDGPEPDQMNLLATMVDWVEKGIAPTSILASHRTSGAVDRTMPLCAYPQVARYKGTGEVRDAANWACGAP
ncbi:tannase/feruloyl esterase family alpha/beta hydrolase [Azohydromonas australica]|uniref:tannase/feruloyl esterase family alpha/beta hydrolase n=1 Tax=Azohydromonas australica TaxID=364039 RepID=UPI0003FF2433|nr:tannase/feruloyl esterase family alpha/beta hydrolase [Azohydromonas australica]